MNGFQITHVRIDGLVHKVLVTPKGKHLIKCKIKKPKTMEIVGYKEPLTCEECIK